MHKIKVIVFIGDWSSGAYSSDRNLFYSSLFPVANGYGFETYHLSSPYTGVYGGSKTLSATRAAPSGLVAPNFTKWVHNDTTPGREAFLQRPAL